MDIAALGTSPNADQIVETIAEYGLERHIVELDAYGFTVIPPEKTGTSPGFTERLREALLRTYRERHDIPEDDYEAAALRTRNKKSWRLIEEDDAVVEAATNPVALAMARWHCGQSAILGGTSSIIKPPTEDGSNTLALHNDTHGVPSPLSHMSHLVNTSWVLTDYESDEDGPTVFVPGSHRWGRLPFEHEQKFWEDDAIYDVVPMRAKAGSLAVWHGNTWHGALGKTTLDLRVTLVLVWMRAYMKPIDMWQSGVSPELIERYPELRKILGLDHPYPHEDTESAYKKVGPFMAAGLDQFG